MYQIETYYIFFLFNVRFTMVVVTKKEGLL